MFIVTGALLIYIIIFSIMIDLRSSIKTMLFITNGCRINCNTYFLFIHYIGVANMA